MEFTTIFDFIGTFAFAISGVRLAARKNFDLFGAYVVGFVTAVGGGTLRDVMLGTTPFWMTTPYYVIITGVALLTVIVLKKWLVRFDSTFFIFDAIGLGFFTVVGLEKSMAADFPMWINIIMGCITGATGGIIRDILLNEVPLIFRKDIYALACAGGGIVYCICHKYGIPNVATQVIAAASVILIRIVAVRYGISLPSLSPDQDDSLHSSS